LELTPEHYGDKAIRRFINVTPELMSLLGFYLADGSCSDRTGIRLSIGKSNACFLDEMTAAFTDVFGLSPRSYEIERGAGELKLVNRAAVLAWQHLFGFAGVDSITKRIPDLAFNVTDAMRLAFLRGFFLGDGTTGGSQISFATPSYARSAARLARPNIRIGLFP
jgi:DNA gyrase subunit B